MKLAALVTVYAIFILTLCLVFGPRSYASERICGTASWYGAERAGRTMANSQPFRPGALTAASWDYPLGTRVRVSRGKFETVVTITDRGPAKRLHRIIDLSQAAAAQLHMTDVGTAPVCLTRLR